MLEGFQQRLLGKAGVKDVRAHGMMFGIELSMPCAELVKKALAEGLLINVTAESVIRLLPPLILNVEESQMIVDKVSKLVLEFLSSQQVESVA